MNRNLISFVGLLVAVFSFTVGSTDAEARYGMRRNRCGQQNSGYQQAGIAQNQNWGSGCGQTNSGCQPAQATAACCASQGGYAQPGYGTAAPVDNSAPAAVPVEEASAPKPAL